MASGPLVTPEQLAGELAGPDAPVVLDCRWDLAGGADRDGYERGHLPGAVFVDLDRDLAAPPGGGDRPGSSGRPDSASRPDNVSRPGSSGRPDNASRSDSVSRPDSASRPRSSGGPELVGWPGGGGRHPLPGADAFQAAMRRAGVGDRRPVVAYDQGEPGGAARAWWLLGWFGHPDVRVLDGGMAAWVAAGLSLTTEAPEPEPGDFTARPGGRALLDADRAAELAATGVLLDVRAPGRYQGLEEPVDPVAGHIPGARNLPVAELLTGHGLVPADRLRAVLDARGVRGDVPVGAYCGSGVAAAQLVLALEVAGLPAALYAGSWSDWVADPSRPVATGPQP